MAATLEKPREATTTANSAPVFVESDITTWTDADHRRVLAEIDPIFQATPGTPEGDRLITLCDLVEAYEEKRYHISEWLAGADARALAPAEVR